MLLVRRRRGQGRRRQALGVEVRLLGRLLWERGRWRRRGLLILVLLLLLLWRLLILKRAGVL